LLEAMASGVPVVASDLPGVRDVVMRSGGGLLTPPNVAGDLAAALRTLLTDAALRQRLGRQARAAVERLYAWPEIISELEALYARALQLDHVARGRAC
ncbi:MAG TPA: glycosyltransferase family 4 protein, partial [Chloroflexota bacterium]|nr:glycosyltransferase family 4 protein [Chloroflexota bacterium]